MCVVAVPPDKLRLRRGALVTDITLRTLIVDKPLQMLRALQQQCCRTLFDDAAFVHHDDLIEARQQVESVNGRDHAGVFELIEQILVNMTFCARIETRRGLIEQHQRAASRCENTASKCEARTLSTGPIRSALSHGKLKSTVIHIDKVVYACGAHCVLEITLRLLVANRRTQ